MADITLETVKAALGITDADRDVLIGALVAGVRKIILREIGLETFDVTEYRDRVNLTSARETIWTDRAPIVEMYEVRTPAGILPATSYDLRKSIGQVLRIDGCAFAEGVSAAFLRYTAGFVEIPDDLFLAAVAMVQVQLNAIPAGGLESERIGQYSYRLSALATGSGIGSGGFGGGGGIPPQARAIINGYMRNIYTN